jgi:hypothetical protein
MNEKLSDDLAAKLLQAIIISLRQNVVPAISDPVARINADQLTRALYLLQSRYSRRGEDLQRLLSDDKELLRDIMALVPQPGPHAVPVAHRQLQRHRSHGTRSLCRRVEHLQQDSPTPRIHAQ